MRLRSPKRVVCEGLSGPPDSAHPSHASPTSLACLPQLYLHVLENSPAVYDWLDVFLKTGFCPLHVSDLLGGVIFAFGAPILHQNKQIN